MTKYRANIDVAFSDRVDFITEVFERFDGICVVKMVRNGPAGGNPLWTIESDDRENMIRFLMEWHDDRDVEFIKKQIYVI